MHSIFTMKMWSGQFLLWKCEVTNFKFKTHEIVWYWETDYLLTIKILYIFKIWSGVKFFRLKAIQIQGLLTPVGGSRRSLTMSTEITRLSQSQTRWNSFTHSKRVWIQNRTAPKLTTEGYRTQSFQFSCTHHAFLFLCSWGYLSIAEGKRDAIIISLP